MAEQSHQYKCTARELTDEELEPTDEERVMMNKGARRNSGGVKSAISSPIDTLKPWRLKSRVLNEFDRNVVVVVTSQKVLEINQMSKDFKAELGGTASSSPEATFKTLFKLHVEYGTRGPVLSSTALGPDKEATLVVERGETVFVTVMTNEEPLTFLCKDWPLRARHQLVVDGPGIRDWTA